MELDGFLSTQDQEASTEIKADLIVFGEDIIKTKFPNPIDGTKDVVRRILWFAKDYKENRAFTRFMGDISEYHVAGDSSIYGAIVRLAQPFMVGQALVDIRGRSGEYYNPGDAAAPRYLEATLSEFARDVYFTNVNLKTIPMIPTKMFNSLEPRYLIPRLPMALILGNLTVGFGFKSHIPMIDFADVCNLVMTFAEHYKAGNTTPPRPSTVARYFIPSFPIRNLIKNKEELLREYAKGNYECAIQVEGWIDLQGNNITLRTVPYGTDFGNITQAIRDQMMNKKSWLWNHLVTVNKYNSDVAELSIELKRGQNPFEVFDKIKGILRFNNKWHPIYNYMRDGRAVTMNPLALTANWYHERTISVSGGLKYKQADLIAKKMMLEAMLVICEKGNEVISIIKSSENEDQAIDNLYKKFNELTWKQAKIIAHQRISVLAKANRKQIETDLEQTETELAETVANFGRINEIIYGDAQYLKKKYAKPKITQYASDFIGYVQIGTWGAVQFSNELELYDILLTRGWPSSVTKSIHLYDSKKPVKYIAKRNRLYPFTENSKEVSCEAILCYPAKSCGYTLVTSDDGSTCVIEGATAGLYEGKALWPISKKFYAIHRNGEITHETVDNFAVRKNVSIGKKTDLVCGLVDSAKDLVIFHMYDSDVNVLRMDKILYGRTCSQFKTVPTGEMYILGIHSLTDEKIYLNIPSACTKNHAMEYLVIENLSEFFTDNKTSKCINISKNSSDVKFKRNKTVRTLYTLNTLEK